MIMAPWWSPRGKNRNHFRRKQPLSSQLTWTHGRIGASVSESLGVHPSIHPTICRQETLQGQTSETQFFLMHDRLQCFAWSWGKDGGKLKEMDREAHVAPWLQTGMEKQLYMSVDLCDLDTFKALLATASIITITVIMIHLFSSTGVAACAILCTTVFRCTQNLRLNVNDWNPFPLS